MGGGADYTGNHAPTQITYRNQKQHTKNRRKWNTIKREEKMKRNSSCVTQLDRERDKETMRQKESEQVKYSNA